MTRGTPSAMTPWVAWVRMFAPEGFSASIYPAYPKITVRSVMATAMAWVLGKRYSQILWAAAWSRPLLVRSTIVEERRSMASVWRARMESGSSSKRMMIATLMVKMSPAVITTGMELGLEKMVHSSVTPAKSATSPASISKESGLGTIWRIRFLLS